MENHNFAAHLLALCCLAGVFLLPAARSAQAQDVCPDAPEDWCPNLEAYPAFDLDVVGDGNGGQKLIFSALTWNSGGGPLELFAGDGIPSQTTQKVYQRKFKVDGTDPTEVMAGEFEWHPAHAHFHFEDYARYTLQPLEAAGGSFRTGSKTTFCVIDTNRIDHRLPGASKKAVYKWCNDDIQGMSVGWGDQYSSYLVGQEIDITGLDPGIYTLEIEADPMDRIRETNDSDNTSCVPLYIDPAAMTVSVEGDGSCNTNTAGGGITLTASGYKVKGKHTVDLEWSDAAGGDVNLTRDGDPITDLDGVDYTNNDGAYTDDIGIRGAGSYTYQVCETGLTPECSDTATVVY
jgi:hypothetical protein